MLKMDNRFKVVQGGTWSGKTTGIIPILCSVACSKVTRTTVVCQTIDSVIKGPMEDFISIMSATGRFNEASLNKSRRKYFFYNGSTIEFQAYDTIGKAKQSGKRDHLFLNEAQYIPFEIADALITRTSGSVWIDYNPTESFWVNEHILNRNNHSFLNLTYKDNETTPASVIEDLNYKMEKAYFDPFKKEPYNDPKNIKNDFWNNYCKVYIYGIMGTTSGVLLKDWSILEQVPQGSRVLGAGMDFGFSNDPTALVVAYDYRGKMLLDLVCYQKELYTNQIAKIIKENQIKCPIYCDVDNRIINDLKYNYSIDARKSDKPAGSISYGISLMQQDHFYVTARSIQLIKELRSYTQNGNVADHAIDAARYFYLMHHKPRINSVKIKV